MHQFFIGTFIQPVVRIHHLEENTFRQFKSFVDTGTVSAVWFMYRFYNIGVKSLVIICNFAGSVRGTVIHNNDLHILTANQKRVNTPPHIILRIIAGHRKCNVLCLFCILHTVTSVIRFILPVFYTSRLLFPSSIL